jgi:hypothetical protein
MFVIMMRMGVSEIAQTKLENSIMKSMVLKLPRAWVMVVEEQTLIKQLGVANAFNIDALRLHKSVKIAFDYRLKDLLNYYTHCLGGW